MRNSMEDLLAALKMEKTYIDMTEEMARRVGVNPFLARQVLGLEKKAAAMENRSVIMEHVAWGIKELSIRSETKE